MARKVDLTTAEQVRQLKIKGIGTLPDSRRTYPQGDIASQVLGAVGTDGLYSLDGLSGVAYFVRVTRPSAPTSPTGCASCP